MKISNQKHITKSGIVKRNPNNKIKGKHIKYFTEEAQDLLDDEKTEIEIVKFIEGYTIKLDGLNQECDIGIYMAIKDKVPGYVVVLIDGSEFGLHDRSNLIKTFANAKKEMKKMGNKDSLQKWHNKELKRWRMHMKK